ncbi:MAG: zinc ribbon domain-containing protein [Burkholderiales bacterium]|nr:zinc ribbon domain-containing protein [Burkholderiales bacterium]OJX05656.1 MAG: FmdB family transcriptional regulator [Burkholderiales bacterium 70-64]
MPIYAYRCDSCGVEKDVLQKLSDAPLTVCPECGAGSFHKKLSAPAFQLKGSGWYVTDFRDGAKKPAAAPEGASAEAKPAEGAPAPAAAGSDGQAAAPAPAAAAPAAQPPRAAPAASAAGSAAGPKGS